MTQLSIELLKAWFIFSFSLGCWTCLNLVVSRRGDRRVKYTILSFILLLLTPPINAYIHLVSGQPIFWLVVLSQKLTWCYGPIMVSLIRHISLKPTSRLSYTIQSLPFLFSLLHDTLNLQWLNFNGMVTLLFIHVFGYLGFAVYLLKSERLKLLKLTSQFKNTTYYWLIYLVSTLLGVMLFDVIVFTNVLLGHIPSIIALATVASMIAIFVNTIALFSIYQPDVFFHILAIPDEPQPEIKPHLRSIELSPEAAKQLDEQLQDLVKNHKPHLDEDISLPKLASLLGVTSHQLS